MLARSLPPRRPHDCAINLFPGTPSPKERLYSLSPPERSAMEKCISLSLAAGIIRPSSPASARFVLCRQDKTLFPWIDYQGFNDITLKNCYPSPLISTAFDQLQRDCFFTKLDLEILLILYTFEREMNGRQPSTLPMAIMSAL